MKGVIVWAIIVTKITEITWIEYVAHGWIRLQSNINSQYSVENLGIKVKCTQCGKEKGPSRNDINKVSLMLQMIHLIN